MRGTKVQIQLVFVVMATMLVVTMGKLSAIECINSCWSLKNPQNHDTLLECIDDPPLEDIMCVVACGSKKNFALEIICEACEVEPPVDSDIMCSIACGETDEYSFSVICAKCQEYRNKYN